MMDYDIRHGRTYMYFKGRPLFPFGHGLSYTTFGYAKLRTSAPALAPDGSVDVAVDVTNTGKVAGDSVVELYAAWPKSKVERPREALVGFARVNVKPGETRTVRIPLAAQRLAYWNTQAGRFEVEAVPVTLKVGESSADIRLTTTLPVRR
jgi:beta-glucosidase